MAFSAPERFPAISQTEARAPSGAHTQSLQIRKIHTSFESLTNTALTWAGLGRAIPHLGWAGLDWAGPSRRAGAFLESLYDFQKSILTFLVASYAVCLHSLQKRKVVKTFL